MPGIESTADELLKLFPRKATSLGVVATVNTPEQLRILYLQRRIRDKNRNWAAYRRWRDSGSAERPEGMMAEIYWDNEDYFERGDFAAGDKLVLSVNLRQDDYKAVRLAKVVRNRPDDRWKGVGAEFHRNLLAWLNDKGYRFLIGFPTEETAAYWRNQGMIPLDDVELCMRDMVNPSMDYGHVGCYFHFLDPNDPELFLKPEARRKHGMA